MGIIQFDEKSLEDIIEDSLSQVVKMYSDYYKLAGKTSKMIEMVKDGDIVVCTHGAHKFIKDSLVDKNIRANVIVINPSYYELSIKLRGITDKTVHIDHFWLESYYLNAMSNAMHDIKFLKDRCLTRVKYQDSST